MSKKSNRPTGNNRQAPKKAPRYLWTSTGARLFDADGREYQPHSMDLPIKEVNRFVRRGQVPFAVHECGGGLEWFDVPDVPALWERLGPDFDTGSPRARRWPSQVPVTRKQSMSNARSTSSKT